MALVPKLYTRAHTHTRFKTNTYIHKNTLRVMGLCCYFIYDNNNNNNTMSFLY